MNNSLCKKIIFTIFVLSSLAMVPRKLREGVYRGVLYLDEKQNAELPFNFEVVYKGKRPLIVIRNGDEKIVVDEINIRGDSVTFKMPVFDTEFKLLYVKDGFEGVWINNYRTSENRLRFKAVFGEEKRFLFEPGPPDPVFEGKWEVIFSPGKNDSSKAIGVFHHVEQTDQLTGTFLTETGDYRFLEGVKNGNNLFLSAFDGSHAYLFTADFKDGMIKNGKFYSGAHWVEEWEGKRNESFQLRKADEITTVKDPSRSVEFSFPDTEGKMVSLEDKRFHNRPVIVQVMGTWCPNCMDESRYLGELYRKYNPEGLEIVALAFEKTNDQAKAIQQVTRVKNRLRMEYPVLITLQTGKNKASEIFSNLNSISAFPTTLFLDRAHKVIKVHTGFSGPATGEEYEKFKNETEGIIQNLLKK
jgi:thiol-disulfide isomerase/thioredoxin